MIGSKRLPISASLAHTMMGTPDEADFIDYGNVRFRWRLSIDKWTNDYFRLSEDFLSDYELRADTVFEGDENSDVSFWSSLQGKIIFPVFAARGPVVPPRGTTYDHHNVAFSCAPPVFENEADAVFVNMTVPRRRYWTYFLIQAGIGN